MLFYNSKEKGNIIEIVALRKKQFGSTREIGIYEMKGVGLIPVQNPSEWLIPADHIQRTSGSCISLVCEGYRPFLIETQALVSTAVYGTAQRSTTGMIFVGFTSCLLYWKSDVDSSLETRMFFSMLPVD
jgi:predicted ATP-dependent serine protease